MHLTLFVGVGILAAAVFLGPMISRLRRQWERTDLMLAITASGDILTMRDDIPVWQALPLPARRKVALIHAGIPASQATSPQVAALTSDDLRVMRSLRTPVGSH